MIEIKEFDFINESELSGPLKRVVLFNDISGFGKCSITTSLPILAAAGIEGCAVPTAILSTHTGNFEGYTFRDLTEDLEAFLGHWLKLGIHFDAIYSGYLGSPKQAQILKEFIKKEQKLNPEILVYVDPVMGDNGQLYSGYGEKLVEAMRELVTMADIVLPNLTEATALLGMKYHSKPYTEDELIDISKKLQQLGPKTVIITGIENGDSILTAVYQNELELIKVPKVTGRFHGTGDIFASFTLAALLNGRSVIKAAELGAYLTYGAVKRTMLRETPRREGVDFEGMLPSLIQELKLESKIL